MLAQAPALPAEAADSPAASTNTEQPAEAPQVMVLAENAGFGSADGGPWSKVPRMKRDGCVFGISRRGRPCGALSRRTHFVGAASKNAGTSEGIAVPERRDYSCTRAPVLQPAQHQPYSMHGPSAAPSAPVAGDQAAVHPAAQSSVQKSALAGGGPRGAVQFPGFRSLSTGIKRKSHNPGGGLKARASGDHNASMQGGGGAAVAVPRGHTDEGRRRLARSNGGGWAGPMPQLATAISAVPDFLRIILLRGYQLDFPADYYYDQKAEGGARASESQTQPREERHRWLSFTTNVDLYTEYENFCKPGRPSETSMHFHHEVRTILPSLQQSRKQVRPFESKHCIQWPQLQEVLQTFQTYLKDQPDWAAQVNTQQLGTAGSAERTMPQTAGGSEKQEPTLVPAGGTGARDAQASMAERGPVQMQAAQTSVPTSIGSSMATVGAYGASASSAGSSAASDAKEGETMDVEGGRAGGASSAHPPLESAEVAPSTLPEDPSVSAVSANKLGTTEALMSNSVRDSPTRRHTCDWMEELNSDQHYHPLHEHYLLHQVPHHAYHNSKEGQYSKRMRQAHSSQRNELGMPTHLPTQSRRAAPHVNGGMLEQSQNQSRSMADAAVDLLYLHRLDRAASTSIGWNERSPGAVQVMTQELGQIGEAARINLDADDDDDDDDVEPQGMDLPHALEEWEGRASDGDKGWWDSDMAIMESGREGWYNFDIAIMGSEDGVAIVAASEDARDLDARWMGERHGFQYPSVVDCTQVLAFLNDLSIPEGSIKGAIAPPLRRKAAKEIILLIEALGEATPSSPGGSCMSLPQDLSLQRIEVNRRYFCRLLMSIMANYYSSAIDATEAATAVHATVLRYDLVRSQHAAETDATSSALAAFMTSESASRAGAK